MSLPAHNGVGLTLFQVKFHVLAGLMQETEKVKSWIFECNVSTPGSAIFRCIKETTKMEKASKIILTGSWVGQGEDRTTGRKEITWLLYQIRLGGFPLDQPLDPEYALNTKNTLSTNWCVMGLSPYKHKGWIIRLIALETSNVRNYEATNQYSKINTGHILIEDSKISVQYMCQHSGHPRCSSYAVHG